MVLDCQSQIRPFKSYGTQCLKALTNLDITIKRSMAYKPDQYSMNGVTPVTFVYSLKMLEFS